MSLLARLSHDRERMKDAIETGTSFQVLVMGAIFIAFVGLGTEIVRLVMGERWMPVLRIFPFIAAGVVVNSGFMLYSSALSVIGAWRDITVFHVVHVLVFATAAAGFVGLMHDPVGYGWAEIVACVSYWWIRRSMHQRLFSVAERRLYVTMAATISLMALLSAMAGSLLWLRLVTLACAVALLIRFSPGNFALLSWLKRSQSGQRSSVP